MSKIIKPSRRLFLSGLFAAPAIIAIDKLMPVKSFLPEGIVDIFDNTNPLILPYKGKTIFDSAAFYCPYVPLQIKSSVNNLTFNTKYGVFDV